MPEILSTIGATVLPASALEATHGNLDQQMADYAFIDINLGDPTSLGVADRVREFDIAIRLRVGILQQATLPVDRRRMMVVVQAR